MPIDITSFAAAIATVTAVSLTSFIAAICADTIWSSAAANLRFIEAFKLSLATMRPLLLLLLH